MDAPEAVEGVAHDCVAGAAAAEHERPCDPLARPGGVAHRRRGVSEWMDATVGIQQVAGRVARRRPWRHHDLPCPDPVWPVHAAVDRRRDAERMKPAPAVHHVSAGPVGEEGETERDVLGRPGGAGGKDRRRPDRVHAAPSVQHVEVALIVDRRLHLRRRALDPAQGAASDAGAGARQ